MSGERRDDARDDLWSYVGPEGSFRVGQTTADRMWLGLDDGEGEMQLNLPAGTVRQIGLAIAAHATPLDPGPVRMVAALEAVAITLEEAPERVPLEILVDLESLVARIQQAVDAAAEKA